MIIEQLLLSLETVQLAKIDNFIRAELRHRAEYAIQILRFRSQTAKEITVNLE
jgi:hypothetical protein